MQNANKKVLARRSATPMLDIPLRFGTHIRATLFWCTRSSKHPRPTILDHGLDHSKPTSTERCKHENPSKQDCLTVWKSMDSFACEVPEQVFSCTALNGMNLRLKDYSIGTKGISEAKIRISDPHPSVFSGTTSEPEYRYILKTRFLCHPLLAIRDE